MVAIVLNNRTSSPLEFVCEFLRTSTVAEASHVEGCRSTGHRCVYRAHGRLQQSQTLDYARRRMVDGAFAREQGIRGQW